VSTVDFIKEGVTRRVPFRGISDILVGRTYRKYSFLIWMPSCQFPVLSSQRRVESTAAAYEVDNFQTIAFREVGSLPLLAGNDAAVQLHGDAIGFHVQLVDQTGEGEGRIEIAGFAIDLQLHMTWIFLYASTLRRWNLRVAVRPE
jgi:hypothetical protein